MRPKASLVGEQEGNDIIETALPSPLGHRISASDSREPVEKLLSYDGRTGLW